MKKKLVSLIMVLAMLMAFVPVTASAATSGTCGDNLTWTLDDEGTLTISGTGAMTDWSAGECPWYPVRNNIKSVIIPDSVTSIGTRAFRGCNKLTSITIPDSVTSIGDEALRACYSLTGIKVDSNNMYYTSDDYGVLYDINKTTLIQYPAGNTRTSFPIPNSVTAIGDYAFLSCDNLTDMTIPNSVTSIGTQAFASCNYLTSLTISKSITAIGDEAFSHCSSLTSITIPDSVTAIGDEAFYGCNSLTDITIPDSVTSIGDYAFYNCDSLTDVTIPNSVTTIGTRAFERCNLTDIKVDSNNMYYTSDDYGVLYDINKSTLIQYPVGNTRTNFIIPDSVTSIGGGAFSYCDSLTSITIPDSVTYIGASAFASCTGLTSITIPDGVTTISNSAFNSCSSLTSVTIPDSVTTIGTRAFFYSSNLTSVTIPDSVTSIGSYAFSNCKNLTSITISDSVTTVGESAFSGCNSLKDVYYAGSESDWNEISIGSSNEPLTDATIHYNWLIKPVFDSESNTIKLSSYKAIDDAELIVALYQEDRFVEATTVPIDISEGNNTINSPVTDYTGATDAKIMIWQDMTTLTPLFNVCTVDLN